MMAAGLRRFRLKPAFAQMANICMSGLTVKTPTSGEVTVTAINPSMMRKWWSCSWHQARSIPHGISSSKLVPMASSLTPKSSTHALGDRRSRYSPPGIAAGYVGAHNGRTTGTGGWLRWSFPGDHSALQVKYPRYGGPIFTALKDLAPVRRSLAAGRPPWWTRRISTNPPSLAL